MTALRDILTSCRMRFSEAQAQPDAGAPETAAPSPKKTRKRVESGGRRSLNCRIATVFPFCW